MFIQVVYFQQLLITGLLQIKYFTIAGHFLSTYKPSQETKRKYHQSGRSGGIQPGGQKVQKWTMMYVTGRPKRLKVGGLRKFYAIEPSTLIS